MLLQMERMSRKKAITKNLMSEDFSDECGRVPKELVGSIES